MFLILLEVLCVFVLGMILINILIDERKRRQRDTHLVKLKGYWDGSNRRSSVRLNIALEVKYSVNGKTCGTKSMNVSVKGIRLLLDEKFEKGTRLALEIHLPNQEHVVKTNGEIVWIKESPEDEASSPKRLFNTGIKFFDFHPREEKRLFDFVSDLKTGER